MICAVFLRREACQVYKILAASITLILFILFLINCAKILFFNEGVINI
jgi:hypothetical protein